MGGTEGSGHELDANKLYVHMKVPNNKIQGEKPLQPPSVAFSLWKNTCNRKITIVTDF